MNEHKNKHNGNLNEISKIIQTRQIRLNLDKQVNHQRRNNLYYSII